MYVEMTTQAEMTFKCTSRSSKVAPIESQCMISYQFLIVTFAVSHLEICPRSLTVVSPESCRVAMYVKCSEDSERMKRKSPVSTTLFSIDAPFPSNPREYLHKPYTARNYVPWATFLSVTVYGQFGKCSNSFARKPETPTLQLLSPKQILTQNGHSRSFKVMYFWYR